MSPWRDNPWEDPREPTEDELAAALARVLDGCPECGRKELPEPLYLEDRWQYICTFCGIEWSQPYKP